MQIKEVIDTLDARLVSGETMLEQEIRIGCGSDLMSDVLAYVNKEDGLLLTGLLNQQVVRTASMLDMRCIAFVRGKTPDQDIIDLAEQLGIALLSTDNRLFTACGKLYTAGLKGD